MGEALRDKNCYCKVLSIQLSPAFRKVMPRQLVAEAPVDAQVVKQEIKIVGQRISTFLAEVPGLILHLARI